MRIVLLNDRIPPENKGGAGVVMWRLAQALHARGYEVHVITATPGASFEAVRDGIPTYHLHVNYPERWRAWLSLYNPQVARPLRSLLMRLKPDVVHAHNIHADLTYHALHLAREMKARVILTSHDAMPVTYGKLIHHIQPDACPTSDDAYRLPAFYNLRRARFRYNPLRQWAIKRALQQCDVRLAVSQALADVHRVNDLPPFNVLHNGLDASMMATDQPTVEALRERLGVGHRPIALIAGRLTREKGLYPTLKAFMSVLERVPNACLLILTSGELASQIPSTYHTLLGRHIITGGWLSGASLCASFHLARVVLAPSVCFDAFPTVNLEAMATQRPVIATCHGGSSEAVIHQETGYIVNPYDVEQFSTCLTNLLTSPENAQAMGHAGYERLVHHFSMDAHVSATLEHYRA